METANGFALTPWVEGRMGLLAPPAGWHPDPAAGRAHLHAHLSMSPRWSRYWLAGAVAASIAGVVLIASPSARGLAQQCLECLTTARFTAAPVVERKMAPDFKLQDADGRTVRLSDYRGKVLLVNFWATWCPPCRVGVPWFVELEQKYKDQGFAVLGVSMDDGWQVVKPFLTQYKVNYRVLLGDEETAALYGGLESLPTTYLIDREGRVAGVLEGLAGKKEFDDRVQSLLGSRR